MSETLASFNAGPGLNNHSNMPEGYEKLDRIEIYQKTDGSEGLRGIITLGAGEEAKEQPFTLKAEPHEIWGFDSDAWEKYQSNSEVWELKNQVAALTQRVTELEANTSNNDNSELKGLEARNEELELENGRLVSRVDDLQTRNDELTKQNQELRERRPPRRAAAIGAVALAALVGGVGGYLLGHHEDKDYNSQPRVERIVTNHAALTAEDRILLTKDLQADQKANRLQVQQIELQKSTVRLARQNKTLNVQIRNGIRRTNYLLEQDLKQGQDQTESEAYGYGGDYSTPTTAGTVGYQYPWNWAAAKYSPTQAEKQLHILGERAKKKGHKVRWIYKGTLPNGARNEVLEVDGTTNTQKVLQALAKYK